MLEIMSEAGENKKKKMKKKTHECFYLPEEIEREILLKLSVKSLVRFSLVNKGTRDMVSTQQFATDRRKALSIMKDHVIYNHWWQKRSIEDHNQNDQTRLRIVDYCDGVECIISTSGEKWVTYLYNPSISKSLCVPTLRKNLYPRNSSTRFGFGCVDGEYKMVVIPHKYRKGTLLKANVCSFKTRSWETLKCSWRSTSRGPQEYNHQVGDEQSRFEWEVLEQRSVFLNRACHWLAIDREGGSSSYFVLTFNLDEEKFGKIAIPDYLGPKRNHVTHLHSIGTYVHCDGCLSLIATTGDRDGQIVAWAMKEYGVVESWTRTIETLNYLGAEVILGFSGRGEVVYGRRGDKKHLKLYNPITKKIALHNAEDYQVLLLSRWHPKKESLVLLNQIP